MQRHRNRHGAGDQVGEVILQAMARRSNRLRRRTFWGDALKPSGGCGPHTRSKGARRLERPPPGPVILTASSFELVGKVSLVRLIHWEALPYPGASRAVVQLHLDQESVAGNLSTSSVREEAEKERRQP